MWISNLKYALFARGRRLLIKPYVARFAIMPIGQLLLESLVKGAMGAESL